MTKKMFPVKAYSDGIIIHRISILDKIQKKAKKNNLIIGEAKAPKNILEVEQRKAEELSTFDDAEFKLLQKWDENPHQAIVEAVGPGRDLGNGNLLVPKVKPGDHILYRGNSGDPLIINKKLYWVIHDHDVYGVVPASDLIK
jgi:co-chaperonin GroES (HSP10)